MIMKQEIAVVERSTWKESDKGTYEVRVFECGIVLEDDERGIKLLMEWSASPSDPNYKKELFVPAKEICGITYIHH